MSILNKKKILVIEDSPSIQMFLRVSFENEGARFSGAFTAAQALAICEENFPDIIILDLGLPDQDGLAILPKLKKMANQTQTKIIILTVRKDRRTIQEAFDKGADGYLTKPFLVEELLEIIKESDASVK